MYEVLNKSIPVICDALFIICICILNSGIISG